MRAHLDELRERIAHAEGRGVVLASEPQSMRGVAQGSALGPAEWLDTGWEVGADVVGAAPAAIPLRAYHELAVDGVSSLGDVFAPVGAVVSLLERLARARAESSDGNASNALPVAFIGEWCWPHADALREQLWREALWVRATKPHDRAWCAEQVLLESTIAAVVVDARGFPLTATRRLHLASRRAERPPAFVIGVRTAREIASSPSAATTRWLVRPMPEDEPRWKAVLVRSKVGGVVERR